MKKNNDYWVTHQNTPNLKRNTVLIGMFFFFSGLNCFLCATLGRAKSGEELSAYLILMGVCLFLVLPAQVLDKRRANRGLLAVVSSAVMCLFVSILVAYVSSFELMLLALLIESSVVVAYVILTKYNQKKIIRG